MEELHQMIEDCEARESKLSEWETEFIESIGNQLADKGGLTTLQADKLEAIWEKVTADG